MKKVFSVLTMFAVALTTGFFSADRAEAVPAFARQMQMPCKSCHFQHFPKLNAFGRAFKVNGYTDVAVDTINGDWGTSLPVNLNMSWVTKIRYLKNVAMNDCTSSGTTSCEGANRGELQIVDEGVFYIGGRIAEHIGAAIEVADGAWANGTIAFGHDLESLNTHLGLTVWSTDGAGPFWGKEIFNTGLIRGSRGWENRDLTQAAAPVYRTGLNSNSTHATNSSSGLTLYANHEWFFAALGAYVVGQHGVDVGSDLAGVYRFALTPPQVWGFDTMIGVYGTFGSYSYDLRGNDDAGSQSLTLTSLALPFGNVLTNVTLDGDTNGVVDDTVQMVGMDFQAQGNITEGITLEIIGNFMLDTDKPSARNLYRRGSGADMKRYQIGFDLGFLNDRLITKFNYLHATARGRNSTQGSAETGNGTSGWQRESMDAVSLGLYYNIRENVSLRPEISWVVGSSTDPLYANAGQNRNGVSSDTEFTLMLMYAF